MIQSAGTSVRFDYNILPLIWHILKSFGAIGSKRSYTSDLCTALDGILFSLGLPYARSVWVPAYPAKLEFPSTYNDLSLLYRN